LIICRVLIDRKAPLERWCALETGGTTLNTRVKGAALWLAVLLSIAVLALAGCGGGNDENAESADTTAADTAADTSAPGTTNTELESLVIGYSNPLAAEEGLRSVGYGAREAIKQLGLPWEVEELDAKLSPDKQVSDIDTFISLDAKAIMSWTLDPGAADAAYKRAVDAGVAMIGLNSTSDHFASVMAADTDTTCVVAEDQAAYIANLIPEAKVLVIGGPPVPSITMSTDCFLDAAEGEGLEILEMQKEPTGTQAGGQKVAETLLLKHPDVQAMWVFSDGDALGASAALAAAGKQIWSGDQEGVVLLSRNGVQAAIDAIKAGKMTATWDNNQPLLGAAAIQILKQILVDNVPAAEVEKRVAIPSQLWDLETIDDYASPLEREVPLPISD
jgi:ribose transport system substrate-binding protein